MEDNNLELTDINRVTDVFTYCNDAGTAILHRLNICADRDRGDALNDV